MSGVNHRSVAISQKRLADATNLCIVLLHKTSFGHFYGHFRPLHGTIGVFFALDALLLGLAERSSVETIHLHGRSGVQGANHESVLQLVVANEMRGADQRIDRKRLTIRFAKQLLVGWRLHGKADGAVGQRMYHASLQKRIEEEAGTANKFALIQDDGL